MKALVYTGPESLEYRDEPDPVSRTDTLVRIEACGICGSDMHAYLGHDERRNAPLILGHEAAGEVLDGIGGFHTYGMIENASEAARGDFLPMGLSQGCRLKHDMPKDRPITRDDVEVPEGRLGDKLRAEQDERFREEVLAATT